MVSEYDIRIRSYLLWEAEGRPQGREREFWFRAEAELRDETHARATWRKPKLVLVPGVPVSRPPQRTISQRVPPGERKTA